VTSKDLAHAVASWGSIAMGFAAALLWLKASRTVVMMDSPKSKGGFFSDDVDIHSTADEQSRWNGYAAVATAITVALQAFATLISS